MSTAPATLTLAVDAVVARWEQGRARSPYTIEKYGSVLSRFTRFAEAHDVTSIAQVDTSLVVAFVNSLGRDRRSQVSRTVSGRTRANRLSALRALFAAATKAGWVTSNPVTGVTTPPKSSTKPPARPLTDVEAERLRYLAGTNPARQRPAVVALLLSGAWASEIASLTAASFDSATARLTLPGVGDRHDRTVTVQPGPPASSPPASAGCKPGQAQPSCV